MAKQPSKIRCPHCDENYHPTGTLYCPQTGKRIKKKHLPVIATGLIILAVFLIFGVKYYDRLSEQGTKLSLLTINSTPSGAAIYINEKKESKTPQEISLPAGSYIVRLNKEGYDSEADIVILKNGEPKTFMRSLNKQVFRSRAGIDANQQNKGTTTLSILTPAQTPTPTPAPVPTKLPTPTPTPTPVITPTVTRGVEEALPKDTVSLEKGETKLIDNLGMKFRYVPAGTFYMGTHPNESGRDPDETLHYVKLTKGFYLQTTEITQRLWKYVMEHNPSEFSVCGDECPVERVSWYDVQKFIKRLNRLDKENDYRLPTEAEWEYACRAGNDTAFSFGERLNAEQANFGYHYGRTRPVASFAPNAWGFYDMHGNVNEWCRDWYVEYESGLAIDPKGDSSSTNRKITRGGAWNDEVWHCRSGNRSKVKLIKRDANNIGFRLVRIAK